MATIKPIDAGSVHRIHSGQVVLDLQGALKELVENSLDAGATSVDVRIKDHGLESIEVVDNGSGIDKADWPSIGLKHHTSKLPSLEQLSQVDTFGFRGEALSALCALSESVTLVTSTAATAPMGSIITLARDGSVADDSKKVARQRGTTLTVTGLFKPLPVRRKEFERTAKREFTKALGILMAYALVPASANAAEGKTGVRLKVESIGAGKAPKRNTVLATDGRGSLRSSVSAVWGPKALEGVVDVDIELEVEIDKAMARREGITETSNTVRVVGLISSASWGQGRTSADRQFTYVNGRPCVLPKITKAVNEVYKSFNTNQVPLAILDFQIPKESVDINVSPDKRTIFVHSEANLVETLRVSLDKFFQPTRSSYVVGGASSTVKIVQPDVSATQAAHEESENEDEEEEEEVAPVAGPSRRSKARTSSSPPPPPCRRSDSDEDELSDSSAPASRNSSRRATRQPSPPKSRAVQQTLDTTAASWNPQRKSGASTATRAPPATGKQAQVNLRRSLAGYASQGWTQPLGASDDDDQLDEEDEEDGAAKVATDDEDEEDHEGDVTIEDMSMPSFSPPPPRETPATPPEEEDDDEGMPPPPLPLRVERIVRPAAAAEDDDHDSCMFTPDPLATIHQPRDRASSSAPSDADVTFTDIDPMDIDERDEPSEPQRAGYRDEIQSTNPTGEATLAFDVSRLRKRYAARRSRRTNRAAAATQRNAFTALSDGAVADAAGVASSADEAEAALARVISKADFSHMQVLGQFNKGFIIARLSKPPNTDDLFIIDQHASDEKYNFETLQRTTVIRAQTLIRPRPLQLTAAAELVAADNLDVLRANGFDVAVDEDAPPGRGLKVALKAMPVSKETVFDFTDLEQLLHMLEDGGGSGAVSGGKGMVRCTKARAMFAMRACRKSVMIGKSLNKGQMTALLRNMGTIDQPWNCPHGRPTMRHLCALTPPATPRSGRDRIDWGQTEWHN